MAHARYAPGRIAIAVCDRCNTKRKYLDLVPDGDKPGLRVCDPSKYPGCWDFKDPYRLPPRQPEPITLRFPRPDVSIAVQPGQIAALNPVGAQFTCVLATPCSILGEMCAGYNIDCVGE
jgi:hypothetical protein